MNIRQGTQDDLSRIAELKYELWEFEKKNTNAVNIRIPEISAIQDDISEFLDQDTHRIFVAEDDSGIFGFIAGYVEPAKKYFSEKDDAQIGVIEAVFIDETHRNAGAGSELMKTIIEWLSLMGVELMELNVLVDNNNAIELYKRY